MALFFIKRLSFYGQWGIKSVKCLKEKVLDLAI